MSSAAFCRVGIRLRSRERATALLKQREGAAEPLLNSIDGRWQSAHLLLLRLHQMQDIVQILVLLARHKPLMNETGQPNEKGRL